MRLRIKFALFVCSAGGVAFSAGACLFRLLGDYVGDQVILAAQ